MRNVQVLLMACLLVVPMYPVQAGAQAPKAAQVPSPQASGSQTTSVPQQTTATFSDWTLRCGRSAPAVQVCEVVQSITSQEHVVAQVAIGRVARGQALHLTILVPPNVSLSPEPTLSTMRDGDPAVIETTWRRCLPSGCLAEGTINDDAMRRIRAWSEPARVVFADAAGRQAVLPFSSRGLSQALDALSKEDAT